MRGLQFGRPRQDLEGVLVGTGSVQDFAQDAVGLGVGLVFLTEVPKHRQGLPVAGPGHEGTPPCHPEPRIRSIQGESLLEERQRPLGLASPVGLLRLLEKQVKGNLGVEVVRKFVLRHEVSVRCEAGGLARVTRPGSPPDAENRLTSPWTR